MDLTYSECIPCGTIFTNPRPGHSILKEYYASSENYKFWAEKIFPATEAVRKQKIFIPRAELLEALCKQHSIPMLNFLEIGPGFGTFCRLMRERGSFGNIHAIEPTPELADALERSGINVTRSFFEDVNTPASVNVITAFEVIEHIPEPAAFLQKCYETLMPGGLLLLTCPNGKGFDTLVLGEDAPALDFEHVTLFNPYSLSMLFQKSGFEVVLTETPGVLDTDIVRNRLERSESLRSKLPLYKRMFCDQWETHGGSFQVYLQKNVLSGNLMVAGIKQR